MNRKVDKAVVGLLLLATVSRFSGLGEQSLWFDEALSGTIARLSAVQVLTNVVGSSHPPGYYFLLHLWQPLGRSEFALRFPSTWCSIAAVALVARLGYDVFDRRTARLAALGMTLAPFQIYYAQEARMYGVAILLSAGIVWTFARAVREGGQKAWWGYTLLVVLGLYVHYYIALVVLALHAWLLVDRKLARRVLFPLALSDTWIVLVFMPQLAQFRAEAGEFLGSARWRAAPHPLEPLRTFHYLLFGHIMPLWIVPVGLFLIIGLLAIGTLWALRRRGRTVWMLILIVLLPIIVALLVSILITPVYVERSFAVVSPALMLLLARIVTAAPRRSPVPYLWTSLVSLMIVGMVMLRVQADPAKPPLREALSLVEQGARASDGIFHLQDASYLPALYYAPERAGALLDVGQRLWLSPGVYALLGGQVIRPGDDVSSEQVWMTTMPGYMGASQRAFLDTLEAACPTLQSWDWSGAVRVRLYATGAPMR